MPPCHSHENLNIFLIIYSQRSCRPSQNSVILYPATHSIWNHSYSDVPRFMITYSKTKNYSVYLKQKFTCITGDHTVKFVHGLFLTCEITMYTYRLRVTLTWNCSDYSERRFGQETRSQKNVKPWSIISLVRVHKNSNGIYYLTPHVCDSQLTVKPSE